MSTIRFFAPGLVLLLLVASGALARSPEKSWDNRCEQCHGDYAEFSRKYLWLVDGQLQGQHHIDDLQLFLEHHYIPPHEVAAVRDLLAAEANSPLRFERECGECHGEAAIFVEKSIWVRGGEITAMGVGGDAREFMQSHQDLSPEDIEFYLKLFLRIAGK